MVKICIIGLGFVGNAMYSSFKAKGLKENLDLLGYDKYKNGGIGLESDCLKSDIVFLALPTELDELTKTYNLEPIYQTCEYLQSNNYSGVVVIKSTIEPETTTNLSNKFFKLEFIHNPEFLSSRTAFHDFHNQTHIVLGRGNNCTNKSFNNVIDFYSLYYPEAKISTCTSLESECVKLFANCFYAVKVQFFTELYLVCQSNCCDFEKVKSMMFANNWINPSHTNIPGPDGQISYGGMCFPKDTNALNNYMKQINSPNLILESCINERNLMRNKKKTNNLNTIFTIKFDKKYQLILLALLFVFHIGIQIYVILFLN